MNKGTTVSVLVTLAIVFTIITGCGSTGPISKKDVPVTPAVITYIDAPYAKLSSEAFVKDYAGKGVSFKAMFLGEWTLTDPYKDGGINTDDRIFLNHRDVGYKSENGGLGISDMAFPEFALSIEKAKSDPIYQMKRGDIFEVKGVAEKVGLPGKKGLHILIHEIKMVQSQ